MSSDPFADMSPAFSPPASTNNPSQGSSYLSRAFNSNVTVVMAIVLFALVVVAFINTLARCRFVHRIGTRQQLRGPLDSQLQPWQQNKGLEKDQIESLPVITYGAANTSKQNSTKECVGTSDDCAVCLSEYQKGEQVRLLPLCNHAFHLPCVDTWLSTHETCPVCRHSVLEPTAYYPQMIVDPAAPETGEHHQISSESSQDAAASSDARGNSQGGAIASSLTTSASRFGSGLIFGSSARLGSAARIMTTSDRIETDVEVGPGITHGEIAVAAAAAISTSNQSASWSFSGILSPGSLGFPPLNSFAGYSTRQQLPLRNPSLRG